MVLVANYKTPEVLKPCEESLDLPTPFVSSQGPAVLSARPASVRPVRSDQLDAPVFDQALVEGIAVVGFVTDETLRRDADPSSVEGVLYECYFVGRSVGHVDGERKTSAVCNCHDLGPLATLGLPNTSPPFFALANDPSTKVSDRSRPPFTFKSSANVERIRAKAPAFVHCWKRRWQVWYGGYRSGRSFQGAPVLSTQRIPFNTSRGSRGGRPRPPSFRLGGGIIGRIRSHWASVRSMGHRSALS